MIIPFLRSSPRIAALYSWLHGTRFQMRGEGHAINRHNAIIRNTTVEIHGCNCRLTIGPGTRLWGCSITLAGDGAILDIGAGCQLRQSRLCVEDPGSRLLIGDQTTMTGATLISQESGLLQIGKDCMIAKNADLRNTDGHPIFDGSRGPHLNPGRDVTIGDHVWIGVGAIVFKGSTIGTGTVIGADSHVRGEIPARCLAFGVPAVLKREGVRWKRERPAAAGSPAETSSSAEATASLD
jgi:acetyltransferase-like isoleucine patch superfamily enzyme